MPDRDVKTIPPTKTFEGRQDLEIAPQHKDILTPGINPGASGFGYYPPTTGVRANRDPQHKAEEA